MNSHEVESPPAPRRVRICRPAFQDMHHLVMPRLSARAELRRHAMKLRFWSRQDARVTDLDWFKIPSENLFVVKVDRWLRPRGRFSYRVLRGDGPGTWRDHLCPFRDASG